MDQDMLFSAIPKGNISDFIVERITQQLISRDLKPGDRLPTEMEFCEKLGVSRNAVREAMKILVAMGVVEIRKPEGTFIVDEYSPKLLNPSMYALILSERNMAEILELNIAMLREICILGRARITPEEKIMLRQDFEKLKQAVFDENNPVKEMYHWSTQFYTDFCRTCQNSLLILMYDVLLKISSDARYKGFEISSRLNRKAEFFHNYELLMEYIEQTNDLTVIVVCDQILEEWKRVLL